MVAAQAAAMSRLITEDLRAVHEQPQDFRLPPAHPALLRPRSGASVGSPRRVVHWRSQFQHDSLRGWQQMRTNDLHRPGTLPHRPPPSHAITDHALVSPLGAAVMHVLTTEPHWYRSEVRRTVNAVRNRQCCTGPLNSTALVVSAYNSKVAISIRDLQGLRPDRQLQPISTKVVDMYAVILTHHCLTSGAPNMVILGPTTTSPIMALDFAAAQASIERNSAAWSAGDCHIDLTTPSSGMVRDLAAIDHAFLIFAVGTGVAHRRRRHHYLTVYAQLRSRRVWLLHANTGAHLSLVVKVAAFFHRICLLDHDMPQWQLWHGGQLCPASSPELLCGDRVLGDVTDMVMGAQPGSTVPPDLTPEAARQFRPELAGALLRGQPVRISSNTVRPTPVVSIARHRLQLDSTQWQHLTQRATNLGATAAVREPVEPPEQYHNIWPVMALRRPVVSALERSIVHLADHDYYFRDRCHELAARVNDKQHLHSRSHLAPSRRAHPPSAELLVAGAAPLMPPEP